MLTKQKIRKLAEITAQSSQVPKDIEGYVLDIMSKHELKEFLRVLKIELDKRRVFVTSSEALSAENLALLKREYKGKEMINSIDTSLGGGIKIKDNDLVIDFSYKKFIDDTIDRIKN